MATFRIAQHSVEPQRAAVEVFDGGGLLIAAIYATDAHIRVVSKYIIDCDIEPGVPPVAVIALKRETT